MSNFQEFTGRTNPRDADSDDDGVRDGDESEWDRDIDNDGLNCALDPDSDNDGIFDGTEAGISAPGQGTDRIRGFFVADTDTSTHTSSILEDTDDGGTDDGAEDWNHNGGIDENEKNPSDPSDDHLTEDINSNLDSDTDGLTDFEEEVMGSNPDDADSDDDGVIDGEEDNWSSDTDGDGLINILDPDSDNDGLPDGLEVSIVDLHADTDRGWNRYRRDDDPLNSTSMVNPDSDYDGQRDGWEDQNSDGEVGSHESNPTHEESLSEAIDSDSDGLNDDEELTLGTDPEDADSDDDGIIDGEEWNWWDDQDQDGLINALDPDSDNDGLYDGTERGITEAGPDTDHQAGVFIPDSDPSTTTQVFIADSDKDGLLDGEEDNNFDGEVDSEAGESDPNDRYDPIPPCEHDLMCSECEQCVDGVCESIPGCEPDEEQPDGSDDPDDSELNPESTVEIAESVPDVGADSGDDYQTPPATCGCSVTRPDIFPFSMFLLGLIFGFLLVFRRWFSRNQR